MAAHDGDLPHVLVLPDRELRQVGLQDAREEVAVALELLDDAHEMVVDVAEVRAHVLVQERERPAGEPVERVEQRAHAAQELHELALEEVDPLRRVVLLRREHRVLDLVDVALEAVQDRQVVVDDVVDDRPEDGAGAAREELGPLLDASCGSRRAGSPRRGARR